MNNLSSDQQQEWGAVIEALRKELAELRRHLDVHAARLDEHGRQLVALQGHDGTMTNALGELQAGVGDLQTQVARTSSQLSRSAESSARVEARLDKQDDLIVLGARGTVALLAVAIGIIIITTTYVAGVELPFVPHPADREWLLGPLIVFAGVVLAVCRVLFPVMPTLLGTLGFRRQEKKQ